MDYRYLEVTVSQHNVCAEWQDLQGSSNTLNYSFEPMDMVAAQNNFQPTGFAVFNAERNIWPPGTIQIERGYEPVLGNPGGPFALFRHRIEIRPNQIRISIDTGHHGGRVGPRQVNNNGPVVAATPNQPVEPAGHAAELPGVTATAADNAWSPMTRLPGQ